MPVSRAHGVDVLTGDGLHARLAGVDAVIDVTNILATDADAVLDFFTTATGNLLAAEQRAGVAHHVVLSIVGVDRVDGNAHYAGKVGRRSARVEASPVPWTIVPATSSTTSPRCRELDRAGRRRDDRAVARPAGRARRRRRRPRRGCGGRPQGRYVDLAGPDPQDLVDMARRTYAARGRTVRLVPTWSAVFAPSMAGNVLLPGERFRIAPRR